MEAIKRLGFGKKKAMDMTQGGIAKNIIVFALPLLVGNLFQQLYNLVDTYVIGQTGNTAAFAAVGASFLLRRKKPAKEPDQEKTDEGSDH